MPSHHLTNVQQATHRQLLPGAGRNCQFCFPYVNAAPIPDAEGILALEDVLADGTHLVLLADMQKRNPGASLTNTAESAIAYVAGKWGLPRSTQWIECDSAGRFDRMFPDWSQRRATWIGGPDGPAIEWKALRHGQHVRSLDGFLETYGQAAERLWTRLQAQVAA